MSQTTLIVMGVVAVVVFLLWIFTGGRDTSIDSYDVITNGKAMRVVESMVNSQTHDYMEDKAKEVREEMYDAMFRTDPDNFTKLCKLRGESVEKVARELRSKGYRTKATKKGISVYSHKPISADEHRRNGGLITNVEASRV